MSLFLRKHALILARQGLMGQYALSTSSRPMYGKNESPESPSIPENMKELNESSKSQNFGDRSREVSGEQTSRMFSGNFMSDQFIKDSAPSDDQHQYDMDGNAHLESVLNTNVPEPYSPKNTEDLKEGVPEGLSDGLRLRGKMWAMEDRIDHSYDIK